MGEANTKYGSMRQDIRTTALLTARFSISRWVESASSRFFELPNCPNRFPPRTQPPEEPWPGRSYHHDDSIADFAARLGTPGRIRLLRGGRLLAMGFRRRLSSPHRTRGGASANHRLLPLDLGLSENVRGDYVPSVLQPGLRGLGRRGCDLLSDASILFHVTTRILTYLFFFNRCRVYSFTCGRSSPSTDLEAMFKCNSRFTEDEGFLRAHKIRLRGDRIPESTSLSQLAGAFLLAPAIVYQTPVSLPSYLYKLFTFSSGCGKLYVYSKTDPDRRQRRATRPRPWVIRRREARLRAGRRPRR